MAARLEAGKKRGLLAALLRWHDFSSAERLGALPWALHGEGNANSGKKAAIINGESAGAGGRGRVGFLYEGGEAQEALFLQKAAERRGQQLFKHSLREQRRGAAFLLGAALRKALFFF